MCDDDPAALVIDNGSGMCKAGFAGDVMVLIDPRGSPFSGGIPFLLFRDFTGEDRGFPYVTSLASR